MESKESRSYTPQIMSFRSILLICALALVALLFSGCSIGSWTIGIGDPTPMGWLTVVLYFLTSYLCVTCMQVEKRGPTRPLGETLGALFRVVRKHWPNVPDPARRAVVWVAIAAMYACLGVNKQLDLQSAITETGRLVLRSIDAYEQRRPMQIAFIVVVLGCAVVAIAMLFAFAVRVAKHFILPLLGVVVTIAFVAIRATSFHDMDILISEEWFGIRVNWLFELGGISLVLIGALARLRAGRVGSLNHDPSRAPR